MSLLRLQGYSFQNPVVSLKIICRLLVTFNGYENLFGCVCTTSGRLSTSHFSPLKLYMYLSMSEIFHVELENEKERWGGMLCFISRFLTVQRDHFHARVHLN